MSRSEICSLVARFAFSLLFVTLALAACADDSSVVEQAGSNPLAPAGETEDCDFVAQAEAAYFDDFEEPAIAKCANIQDEIDKGKIDKAIEKLFDLIDWSLDHPSQIEDFDALASFLNSLANIIFGFDLISGDALESNEIGFGIIDENGDQVVAFSAHAALVATSGFGGQEIGVWLSKKGDPLFRHDCLPGFGFDPGHDCYPQFWDYILFDLSTGEEVTLEELDGGATVNIGQCLLDTGPFAPDGVTAARVQLAGIDHDTPGEIRFHDPATAPSAVSCADLVYIQDGWRKEAWEFLGPFQGLFSVTSAYAYPGPLGASVSAFSPAIPTDTQESGPRTDGQGTLLGTNSAEIELYGDVRPDLTDNFTVVFHAVNDPDVNGKTFVATSITEYNEFTPTSGTCSAASNFVMEGELNGIGGHYVIARFGDGEGTGHDDTARVQVFDGPVTSSTTSGGIYDTHTDEDFADESSCVGTARTGVDAGDFIIELEGEVIVE